MRILLKNGRLVDPSLDLDTVGSVLIDGSTVTHVDAESSPEAIDRIVDCAGLIISPGWIDMHVHLRVPGQEYKETVATGTAAAAAGGFTAIACMPNTVPALDTVAVLEQLKAICDAEAVVAVYPIAAITIGRAGEQLVDFDALSAAGAVGFSDDGISTADSALMLQALEASARLDKPIMVHCEDPSLIGGVMHLGEVSKRLGLDGIAAAAEESFIARDCLLAAETGGWLHALHVSTGNGIDLIKLARTWGARVTSEVMPHHLVMTDEWVAGSRKMHNTDDGGQDAPSAHPDTKVNPPLRPDSDTKRLLTALQQGDFDILGTDHAPHAESEKRETTMERAAFGMIGLEVAIPTMLALVRAGHLTINQVIDRFAIKPAQIWNLPVGQLRDGGLATLTVIDPHQSWVVTDESLKSKSKNTPLMGMTMTGRAVMTVVEGKIVHDLIG